MYCVKCKKKTETINSNKVISKNNKQMIKGICTVCGSKKSMFVNEGLASGNEGSVSGQGFLNNLIGKLPVELHLPAQKGEDVPNGSFNNLQKYSYCGPGTRYEERNRQGYQGINELDKMCKLHDQFYNENDDTASRNVSDEALAHRANEIASDTRFDSTQRNMAKLVYYIMKNKARFGLGLPEAEPKNLKRGSMRCRQ